MLGALSGVRKTSIRRAGSSILVTTARSVGDYWALHLLNGANTGQNPEIRVSDPRKLGCKRSILVVSTLTENDFKRELTLHRLKEITGMVETSIGAVGTLGGKSHGSAIAATGAGDLIVCAASVPGKADQDGAVAAIIVIFLLLETTGDLVVDLLVVLLGGVEDLGRGRATLGEQVVAGTSNNSGTRDVY